MNTPGSTTPHRDGWRVPVAVVVLVWSILGLAGGVAGLIGPYFPQTPAWVRVLSGISVALFLLLLFGAVLLLRRRRAGACACVTWALGHIALTAASVLLHAAHLKEQGLSVAQSVGGTTGFVVMMGFGLCWQLALPVFLIVWFSRRGVRGDLAGWSSGGALTPEPEPAAAAPPIVRGGAGANVAATPAATPVEQCAGPPHGRVAQPTALSRVRPALRTSTSIGWSLAAGLVVGFVIGFVMATLSDAGDGPLFWSCVTSILGFSILVWSLALVFLTPRASIIFSGSAVFATCVVSGAAMGLACDFDGTSSASFVAIATVVQVGSICGALVGLAAMTLAFILDALGMRIIEQHGAQCWRCGYTIHPASLAACPECGLPAPLHGTRGVLHQLFTRRSRWVVAPVLLGTVIFATVLAVRAGVHEGRASSFRTIFPSDYGVMSAAPMYSSRSWPFESWTATGSLIALDGHADKALLLLYEPAPRAGQPAVQIRLVWLTSPLGAFADGAPPIACDLDQAQADRLMELGAVPAALGRALLDASVEEGWPASFPAPGPGGFGALPASPGGPRFVDAAVFVDHSGDAR